MISLSIQLGQPSPTKLIKGCLISPQMSSGRMPLLRHIPLGGQLLKCPCVRAKGGPPTRLQVKVPASIGRPSPDITAC